MRAHHNLARAYFDSEIRFGVAAIGPSGRFWVIFAAGDGGSYKAWRLGISALVAQSRK
jgi:hypothetical protein